MLKRDLFATEYNCTCLLILISIDLILQILMNAAYTTIVTRSAQTQLGHTLAAAMMGSS